jgi:hypothetical protein
MAMDILPILLALVALVVLDLTARRFGRDARPASGALRVPRRDRS